MYRGGPPWEHLKPPLSWKNHVAAKIVHVAANILRVAANILHVMADKTVEEAKSSWPKKIFWPPSPYSKFYHTDENVSILYLKVIIKFGFFQISNPPPPISAECRTLPMMLIEVAP